MANEDEIWSAYAKGVKPIKRVRPYKNNVIPAKAGTQRSLPLAITEKSSGSRIAPLANARGLSRMTSFSSGLDRNLEKRLRQGAIVPEARLDLHGMKQVEAHAALEKFLAVQVKVGKRLLLIITGKGRSGSGVLRANLPNWLAASDTAPHILALRPAAIRHGGDGAFYLLLKKRKGKDA